MKKVVFCFAFLLLILSACCNKSKTAVVYFSATGNTRLIADSIAKIRNCAVFEIVPETLYSETDLDWRIPDSRNQIEEHDPSIRPAIKAMETDFANYDTVFVGFPIWAGCAPRIINTFVESANLSNVVLVPFCTSGGSEIAPAVAALRATYPQLNWLDGKRTNTLSSEEFFDFVK